MFIFCHLFLDVQTPESKCWGTVFKKLFSSLSSEFFLQDYHIIDFLLLLSIDFFVLLFCQKLVRKQKCRSSNFDTFVFLPVFDKKAKRKVDRQFSKTLLPNLFHSVSSAVVLLFKRICSITKAGKRNVCRWKKFSSMGVRFWTEWETWNWEKKLDQYG